MVGRGLLFSAALAAACSGGSSPGATADSATGSSGGSSSNASFPVSSGGSAQFSFPCEDPNECEEGLFCAAAGNMAGLCTLDCDDDNFCGNRYAGARCGASAVCEYACSGANAADACPVHTSCSNEGYCARALPDPICFNRLGNGDLSSGCSCTYTEGGVPDRPGVQTFEGPCNVSTVANPAVCCAANNRDYCWCAPIECFPSGDSCDCRLALNGTDASGCSGFSSNSLCADDAHEVEQCR